MTPAWRWYLMGGGLVAAVQASLPPGLVREAVYVSIGASVVVAVLVGVRLHRPARRTPWYLMAAGLSCWTAGDVLWGWFDHVVGIDPFPSFADVFFLLGYPLLAVGVSGLTSGGRRGRRRQDRSSLVDAAIVALGTGLVLYVAFVQPTWTVPEGSLLERVVGVAYPVGDLVLLAQLVHLGVRLIAHSVSLRLLAAALLLVLLADGAFQASAYLPVVEENIRLLDTGWLAGSLLWGAAALHPSMRAAGETHVAPDRTFTVGRLVFLSTSVLLLPLTVLAETAVGARVHMTEVALVSAALIGLVLVRMVMMLRRMTEQSDRLAHLADTDFLTGLESRRRFTERLATALHDGPPLATHASAVLLIGLERFTEINDTLGHRTGDELLRAVATRLRAQLDPAAGVARMGGSVFGVLLPAGTGEAAALATAHAARELLLEPLVLSDVSVTIDSGVGVVLLERTGVAAGGAAGEPLDEGEVLHRADVALSAAREGDGRVAAYASEMENGGSLAPVLMAELRSALESGEVVVHFQPQIEVASGRVLGAEALVRWQHPEHGLLGPMTFVPAAERTGLIRLLTLYVLDRSLAQCAVWQAAGRDLTVSVNLSVRNLLDPGLVADVREALARHRLAPSLLELEITETMAMVDPTRSVEVLGALDALGVTLSIDDYGTGYGSLAYLQRLPVRRLKIDRSFVAGVLDDAASAAIVRSTIELAHHLGLTVVAEGVEDDETLLTLRDMRCYAAQGFGIGRPVASESLAALVDAIHARVPGLVGADELVRVPRLAGAALLPGGR